MDMQMATGHASYSKLLDLFQAIKQNVRRAAAPYNDSHFQIDRWVYFYAN